MVYGSRFPANRRNAPGSAILTALLACLACSGTQRPGLPAPADDPPVLRLEVPPPAAKIDPDLGGRLKTAGPDDRFRAIVDLSEQLDVERFHARLSRRGLNKVARRDAAIAALEAVAERQQRRVLPRVEALIAAGELDYARPVAIVNRLLIEGRAVGLLAVGELPEVARVDRDWSSRRAGAGAGPSRGAGPPAEEFESWAIEATGADRLWRSGLTGRGVVVATIDTGAYGEHEQLRGRSLDEGRGWFDPVEGSSTPGDQHGHGTAVLSVAVGANPEGRRVGLAPEARWAAALGNWQNYYSKWRMTLAADWVLRVARPDVLINAWSHDEGECADFDLAFISAWRLAEIFVVFPSGNAGPGESSGESPANLPGARPGGNPVFSTGALDRDLRVLAQSSRGPSRCGAARFPSVSAPGSDLPHAGLGSPSSYRTGWGTSLAAGIVGGAAALLLQADPELSPYELEHLLVDSARDIDPPGPDAAAGAGVIDLAQALEALRRRRS